MAGLCNIWQFAVKIRLNYAELWWKHGRACIWGRMWGASWVTEAKGSVYHSCRCVTVPATTVHQKAANPSCFPDWWAVLERLDDTQIKWHRGHSGERSKWPKLQQCFCKVNELIHSSIKRRRTWRILATRVFIAATVDFICSYQCATEVLRLISLVWALYFIQISH